MNRSLNDTIAILINAAWRRRYLICLPVLLLPVLAFLTSHLVAKSYSTRMSILVQEPAALNPFLEEFALSPNLKERIKPLQALLKSEHVLGEVLLQLGEIDEKTPPLKKAHAIDDLAKSISSELVGTEVITLTLKGPKAEGLAVKLNAISKSFIERIVAPGRSSVESSEQFLKEQMMDRQMKLQQAEARLAAFKFDNSETLPEIYRSNVTRLASLQDIYDTRLIELSAADRALDDLRKRLSGTNPLIGQLEEQIVSLSSELVSMKARYTEQHSLVKNTEAKLSRLRAERSELLQVSTEVSDTDLNRLFNIAMGQSGSLEETGQSPFLVSQMLRLQDAQSKKVTLEKEVEQIRLKIVQLNRGIARFGPVERKMQGLERDIRIAQGLYEKLAERYEMARVTGALGRFEAPERVKIVDAPYEPLWPDTPGSLLFVLAGLFGGMVLGISLATLAELFDQTVRSAHDLSHQLGLPVLARLSYIEGMAESPQTAAGRGYCLALFDGSSNHANATPRDVVGKTIERTGRGLYAATLFAAGLGRDVGVQIFVWLRPLSGSLFLRAVSLLRLRRRP